MCRDGSSFMWHQPCQCYKYITSVDIQKHALFFYKDCSLGSVKTKQVVLANLLIRELG